MPLAGSSYEALIAEAVRQVVTLRSSWICASVTVERMMRVRMSCENRRGVPGDRRTSWTSESRDLISLESRCFSGPTLAENVHVHPDRVKNANRPGGSDRRRASRGPKGSRLRSHRMIQPMIVPASPSPALQGKVAVAAVQFNARPMSIAGPMFRHDVFRAERPLRARSKRSTLSHSLCP